MPLRCSTCGISLLGAEGFVKFNCPQCAGTTIIRCRRCKKLSNRYNCPACGFEGP
ncbi:MAG: zinc finger domain-containing protein [Candidatus Aenigmatarchaeota archaeon]|nr:DUF1610 domain-containing protein [Candidatus Aenigmarchaeota archaeon]